MKFQRLSCPNCNASLSMELTKESEYIYCPYCGQQFHVDNEKKESTYTKNININKKIHHIKTDEAKIEKIKADAKEEKFILIILMGLLILCCGGLGLSSFMEDSNAKKEEQAGKVNVGSHYDYEERNYEVVLAEFQAKGFMDIDTIDLDDAGLFKNKADTVESVSVNGNSKFTWRNCFYTTDKVIISYH